MPRLIHKETQATIVQSVLKTNTLWERIKGLLGEKNLPSDTALWIAPCSTIHTFFMKFPIDIIFVDKNLKVTSLAHSIPSSRIVFGGWGAHSTFEMRAEQLKKHSIKKGDELYVDH